MGPLTLSIRSADEALTGEGSRHQSALRNAAGEQDDAIDTAVVVVPPGGSRDSICEEELGT
jgi:hypothetical protein